MTGALLRSFSVKIFAIRRSEISKSHVYTLPAQRFWTVEIFCSKIRKIFYTFKYSKCFYESCYENSSQVNFSFAFNPYPWILGKKIQNAGPSPSVFCEKKNPERSIEEFCYHIQHILYRFLCFEFFFQKSRLAKILKNGIYFCSARHITSHIGICHVKLALWDSPTDSLSAHNFIFLV